MAKNKYFKGKYLFLLLLSLLLVFAYFYYRDELEHLGSFGIFGIFLISALGSATLFVPGPTIATVIAGGIVYNPFLVAVVSAFGSALGDMLGYVLGHSGKHVFIGKHPNWYFILKEAFHKSAFLAIIFMSIIPNPFFDAVGLVAGIFAYSPLKFFIYVCIGRFFRNLLLAYLGASF